MLNGTGDGVSLSHFVSSCDCGKLGNGSSLNFRFRHFHTGVAVVAEVVAVAVKVSGNFSFSAAVVAVCIASVVISVFSTFAGRRNVSDLDLVKS